MSEDPVVPRAPWSQGCALKTFAAERSLFGLLPPLVQLHPFMHFQPGRALLTFMPRSQEEPMGCVLSVRNLRLPETHTGSQPAAPQLSWSGNAPSHLGHVSFSIQGKAFAQAGCRESEPQWRAVSVLLSQTPQARCPALTESLVALRAGN